MKTLEILEQLQRRKSPEEKAALAAAPDAWRLQLRKEITAINNLLGVHLVRPVKFNKDVNARADFGGEYHVSVSGDPDSFTKHERLGLWKKAMAKKIIDMEKSGLRAYDVTHNRHYRFFESMSDTLGQLDRIPVEGGSVDDPKRPLRFAFYMIVRKGPQQQGEEL
jgi:hypothetical protein